MSCYATHTVVPTLVTAVCARRETCRIGREVSLFFMPPAKSHVGSFEKKVGMMLENSCIQERLVKMTGDHRNEKKLMLFVERTLQDANTTDNLKELLLSLKADLDVRKNTREAAKATRLPQPPSAVTFTAIKKEGKKKGDALQKNYAVASLLRKIDLLDVLVGLSEGEKKKRDEARTSMEACTKALDDALLKIKCLEAEVREKDLACVQ